MSYTLNASAVADTNPYLPANWAMVVGNFRNYNGSGISTIDAFSNPSGLGYHNVSYGNVITIDVTFGATLDAGDYVYLCAVVRSGANAGCKVGVQIQGNIATWKSETAADVETTSGNVTLAAAPTTGDVARMVYTKSTGNIQFYFNGVLQSSSGDANDTTYGGEASLAAGLGLFSGNTASERIATYFADGQSVVTTATLSSPTPSGTLGTSNTATVGATTDHSTAGSNNLFVVVDSAANLSGVTASQIKLGQKANGTAAAASGSSAVSTTTPSVSISGLSGSTLYSYAIVQNDANGDSNVVTGTFTTAAASFSTTLNLVDNSNVAIANGYALDYFEVAAWPTGTGSLTVRSYGNNITSISGGALTLTGPNSGSGVVFVKSHSDSTIVGIYNVTWA